MTHESPSLQIDTIIEYRHIKKKFGDTWVLDDITFDIERGAVHALVGENGAGKSTLVNITSGVHLPEGGTVRLDGEEVRLTTPRRASALGIGMIHQELGGMESLTIAENILLGHEPRKLAGLCIDYPQMNRIARQHLERLHVDIPVTKKISELTVGQCQIVEIAKALSLNARILIMDEPTSALSAKEIAQLLRIIANLKSEGITIVYISHRLDEIFAICDAITVLRDGQHVTTSSLESVSTKDIVKLMVGTSMSVKQHRKPSYTSRVCIKTQNLSVADEFDSVSLSIREGEVFGLFGLLGSGRTEFASALYGMYPAQSGTIWIYGKKVAIRNVRRAQQLGIAYVPEDRKRHGLFPHHSVRRNIIAGLVGAISRLLWVPTKKTTAMTDAFIRTLNIRTPSMHSAVGALSGGNQQKTVLARWLATKPTVLILDEPTRGIDIGAKAQIYELINALAADHVAILLISSELPEIFRVSDTIGVLRNGKLVSTAPRKRTSMEKVMQHAGGEEHA